MKNTILSANIDEPRRIVHRRINFVSKLAANPDDTNDTDELINVDDKWYALPGKDYQGLRGYLLLTCFDILGQDNNDVPKHLGTPFFDSGREEYIRNYFYSFINTVISPSRKQDLLDSITVIKKDKLTDAVLLSNATAAEKLSLLFEIRCYYIDKETSLDPDEAESFDMASKRKITNSANLYTHVQWKPAVLTEIIKEVLCEGK